MIAGEPVGAKDVEPVAFAVEGAAGLVGMEDGALHQGFADGDHGEGGFFTSFFDEVGEGSLAERTIEKLGEGFAEALVGDELIAAEVEGSGLDVGAVLRGGVDSFGKGGEVFFATAGAGAFAGTVFGDFDPDGREVVNLSYLVVGGTDGGGFRQGAAAVATGLSGCEVVVFDVIGMGDFFQGGAGVAILSAGLASGLLAKALGLGPVGEVGFVGGGRFAAGAAVALQFGKPCLQLFELPHPIPQHENQISHGLGINLGQGNEFFSGGTLHGDSYGDRILKLS